MIHGQIIGIQVTPGPQQPVRSVDQVLAIAHRGLEGDHHAVATVKPDHQVTLIEQEALDAVLREYELIVSHAQSRRNLLTRNVPLNHLVGREFLIGPVRLRGIMLCEPCGYLEKMTVTGIKRALIHRGGLRAEIVDGGKLEVGQLIQYVGELG